MISGPGRFSQFGSRAAALASTLVLLFAVLGCESLEHIPANQCGNRVLEHGEECDDPKNPACRKPGVPNECRLDCTMVACPKGAGCSADAVCRMASGSFDSGHFEVGHVDSLRVADVNGDLRDDLLLQSAPRPAVMLFGKDQKIHTINDIPLGGDVLVPGRLAGTRFDDLVAYRPLDRSVKVLYGDESGNLLPVSHILSAPESGPTKLFAADSDGDGEREPLMLVGTVVDDIPRDGVGFGAVLDKTLVSAEQVPGHIPAGNWNKSTPCDEIALAARKAHSVPVYSLCVTQKPVATVQLPADQSIGEGGAFAGDVDGDGLEDLVFDCRDAKQPPDLSVCVSYGLADGSYDDHISNRPKSAGDNKAGVHRIHPDSKLLALAELDGDGKADFVLETGLLLTHPSDCKRVDKDGYCTRRMSGRWYGAVAADFNRDGILDVIGTPGEARALTFAMGLGKGAFNEFSVATAGVTARADKLGERHPVLVAGDFDGDLVSDLAFAERDGRGDDSVGLSVLFGQALATPAAQKRIGNVNVLHDLCAASLQPTAADHVTDLVMLASAHGAEGLGLFAGQTDRVMFSPLAIPVDSETRALLTLDSVMLARLQKATTPPRSDMIMVVLDKGLRQNLYFLLNSATGFAGSKSDTAHVRVPPGALDTLAVVDVEGDGIDEVIAGSRLVETGHYRYWTIRRNGTSDGQSVELGLTEAELHASELRGAGDVDGDGHADVELLAYGAQGVGYQIILRGGLGGARLEAGYVIPLDADYVHSNHVHAYLNIDDDPELELALAMPDRIVIQDLSKPTPYPPEWEVDAPLRALVAGDFDGNGVDDLAALGSDVSIFWGEAQSL